jgi:DNA mismatch repair protein PMS2
MGSRSSLTSHYQSKHPRKKVPGQTRQRVRAEPVPFSTQPAAHRDDDVDSDIPEETPVEYDDGAEKNVDDNGVSAGGRPLKRKAPADMSNGNVGGRKFGLTGSVGSNRQARCGCCAQGEHVLIDDPMEGGAAGGGAGSADPLQQARDAQLQAAAGFKSLSDAELADLAGKSARPRAITRTVDVSALVASAGTVRPQPKDAAASNVEQGGLFTAKLGDSTDAEAEAELDRVINKEDFEKMEILGQFNLGFMVVRHGEDLFFIDQHASDEKYNFERLQRTTKIRSQRLFASKRLQLTAVAEEVVVDNIEIFRKNGFDFEIKTGEPPTKRVRLSQIPLSKGTVFDASDVDELIFMLSEKPGVMCTPSRLRSMFAMRACRSSVMIGTALQKSKMRTLVNHMGTMDQPWNCPHGRPTMRHVFDLRNMPE